MICNSWELLLKAKLISDSRDKNSIYYKKVKGKNRRSLALRDCLSRVFLNENDPIRRNIECITDLRDEVVHLVIDTIPKDILALFQACVLNYHKKLIEWFNISLSERIPVGMMTIVYDFSPDQLDLNNSLPKKRLGPEAANYLLKFQAGLKQNFENLDKSAEFSMDINYKLAFVKNVKDSDIAVFLSNTGDAVGVVEIPKESGKTHPYRRKEAIEKVNMLLESKYNMTTHNFTCILSVYDIRKRSEFYYCSTVSGSPHQYSHSFVEWIVAQYDRNNKFFQTVRAKGKILAAKKRWMFQMGTKLGGNGSSITKRC